VVGDGYDVYDGDGGEAEGNAVDYAADDGADDGTCGVGDRGDGGTVCYYGYCYDDEYCYYDYATCGAGDECCYDELCRRLW